MSDPPIAPVHPLAELALSKLVERGGKLELPDRAVVDVATAFGAELRAERAGPATEALVELAMFLDVKKQSPAAANTLLTICLAAGPVLEMLGDERSKAAAGKAADAQARFSGFVGDERVTKVLEHGARPEGTVPASPLSRFQLQVPPKSDKR